MRILQFVLLFTLVQCVQVSSSCRAIPPAENANCPKVMTADELKHLLFDKVLGSPTYKRTTLVSHRAGFALVRFHYSGLVGWSEFAWIDENLLRARMKSQPMANQKGEVKWDIPEQWKTREAWSE